MHMSISVAYKYKCKIYKEYFSLCTGTGKGTGTPFVSKPRTVILVIKSQCLIFMVDIVNFLFYNVLLSSIYGRLR